MNPLTAWTNLKPMVKMTIIICGTLVMISSMAYGYFDDIIGLFK